MTEEKKFNKVKYDNEYIANNYDRVNLTMPKGKKEIISQHAKDRNESINGFVNRAIEETIQRDTKAGETNESM